jgi:DNA topoisomerase-3
MKLILCEKPKVGRDTARLLGVKEQHQEFIVCRDETVVTWAIGHLLEQDEPASYDDRYKQWSWHDLPIVPDVFTVSPKPST